MLAVDPTRQTDRRCPAGRPDPHERDRRPSACSSARWPRAARGRELPRGAGRRGRAACAAAGFDLVIVETPGIGQGDAGIVERRRRLAVRDDPRVRGRRSQLEKIEMLDFADVVAINKFERRGRRTRCATCAASSRATARRRRRPPRRLPVFGTVAARFNDDGVTRCTARCAIDWPSMGLRRRRGVLATPAGHAPSELTCCAAGRVRYLAEIAETVRELPRAHRGAGELGRERSTQLTPRAREQLAPRRARRADAALDAAESRAAAGQVELPRLAARAGRVSRVDWRRRPRSRAATGRRADHLSGTVGAPSGAARFADRASWCGSCAGEPARSVPLHRRGVRRSGATTRTPPACSPARATPPAPTPVPLLCRGPAGHAAVDRLRLGHALRLRPRRAARHLRQGRHSGVSIATLDDMGCSTRVRPVRPVHVGVDDHQRPGARSILAMFLNTAIDQQVDRFVAREPPRAREPSGRIAHGPQPCAAPSRPTS